MYDILVTYTLVTSVGELLRRGVHTDRIAKFLKHHIKLTYLL
jgi:hypothetical protein